MEKLIFQELETPELNGSSRDFIDGVVAGVAAGGGIIAILALT